MANERQFLEVWESDWEARSTSAARELIAGLGMTAAKTAADANGVRFRSMTSTR
jgi:hypothetical protein